MASAAEKILLTAAFGAASFAAGAAEWALSPQFSGDADSQSNRTLHAGTPSSQSFSAGMDLGLERLAETSAFNFLGHYDLRRYTDDVVPDTDNSRVVATLRFDGERDRLQFGAVYADESTLTTELAESGVIHADAARITRGANAAWTFLQTSALSLDTSANFQQIDYTGGYQGELNGYQYAALSAGESYRFSPRVALSFTAFGSALDSTGAGSESRELGASVGVNFAWTEQLNLALQVGASRRDLDGESSSGGTGNFSLTWLGETREFGLNYAQSLQPFATGVLTERETAEMNFTQRFDSRLSSLTRLGFARNEDAGFGTTFDSRNYRYLETELRWQITEGWHAGLQAGYASATDLGAPDSVGGWSLIVRSGWTPQRHVLGH